MLMTEENYRGWKMEQKKRFVEEIKNRMDDLEIHISRVPRHTKRWFIDYANDYFEGDYGCCLKHIVDMFRGMTPVGYEELQLELNELREALNGLRMQIDIKSDENVKTMVDGKTKRRVGGRE